MRKPYRGPWEPLQSDYFDGGTTCDINFGTVNAAFNSDIPLSILALVRFDGATAGPQYIYSKSNSSGYGLRLIISSVTNQPALGFASTGNTAYPQMVAAGAPNAGDWVCIAASTIGSLTGSTINLYWSRNGGPLKLDNGTPSDGSGTYYTNAADNMHIGEREASTNRSVKGPIAYVIRWARTLSYGELLMRQRTAPYDVGDAIFNYYNGYDHGPYRLPATKAGLFQGQLPGFVMAPYARRSAGAAPPSGGAAGYAGFVAG